MTTPYDFPEPGLYLDAGCRNVDELNTEIIDMAKGYGFAPQDNPEVFVEFTDEISDEAIDFLNSLETREGFSWGFGDNAEGFGLWQHDE
jgi:hypothetical protein